MTPVTIAALIIVAMLAGICICGKIYRLTPIEADNNKEVQK